MYPQDTKTNKTVPKVNIISVIPVKNNSNKQTSLRMNFFNDVKFMLYCSKLFGIFTLQNISSDIARNLRHKLFCFESFWGLLLIGIVPPILLDFGRKSSFKYYFKVLQCVRGLIISLLSSYCDGYLPYVFDKTENVESALSLYIREDNVNRMSQFRFNKIMMYSMYFGSISFLVINTVVEHIILKKGFLMILGHSTSVLNVIPRQLYIVLYMYICHNITGLFILINTCWKDSVQKITEKDNQQNIMEGHLEKLRLLHNDLTKAVRQLNYAYGLRLAFYLATVFLEVLSDLYIYFFENKFNYLQIEYNVFNVVTLYALTFTAHKLAYSVST